MELLEKAFDKKNQSYLVLDLFEVTPKGYYLIIKYLTICGLGLPSWIDSFKLNRILNYNKCFFFFYGKYLIMLRSEFHNAHVFQLSGFYGLYHIKHDSNVLSYKYHDLMECGFFFFFHLIFFAISYLLYIVVYYSL